MSTTTSPQLYYVMYLWVLIELVQLLYDALSWTDSPAESQTYQHRSQHSQTLKDSGEWRAVERSLTVISEEEITRLSPMFWSCCQSRGQPMTGALWEIVLRRLRDCLPWQLAPHCHSFLIIDQLQLQPLPAHRHSGQLELSITIEMLICCANS